MRILLVGKFPPIEGGVSAQTFWLTKALVSHGHTVCVLSNSCEVEPSFRQFHYGHDRAYLHTSAELDALRLADTTSLAPGSYLPYAEPFVTKLFGLGLATLRERPCDIILGWYLEPYGFAAALLAHATGLPLVIRHAGSDLERLAHHPDLRVAYQWVAAIAAGVIVTNDDAWRRLGDPTDRRVRIRRPRLPAPFLAKAEPLDVTELLTLSAEWFRGLRMPQGLTDAIARLNSKPFPGDAFTIGCYGKVGASKGSFDLLEALGRLAKTGSKFVFVAVSSGRLPSLEHFYRTILDQPELSARSWVLPPIAPWRVPAFLQRCDAVCFLEREFPIASHGPLVPREVLSSGACLVCSGEVAAKRDCRENFVDDRNVAIVADPRDTESLTRRIDALIADRDATRAIGRQGQHLSRFWEQDLPSPEACARALASELQSIASHVTDLSVDR